jgi:hypothetical protein
MELLVSSHRPQKSAHKTSSQLDNPVQKLTPSLLNTCIIIIIIIIIIFNITVTRTPTPPVRRSKIRPRTSHEGSERD